MRNAPSVTYPVGRCAFHAALLLLLGVLGLCAMGVWWWSHLLAGAAQAAGQSVPVAMAGAALWLVWSGLAWRGWRHAPVGQLQWDASALADGASHPGVWRWQSRAYQQGAALARIEVMVDLQFLVVLRLHNSDGAASWVWVERQQDPARWIGLRRALMATTRV